MQNINITLQFVNQLHLVNTLKGTIWETRNPLATSSCFKWVLDVIAWYWCSDYKCFSWYHTHRTQLHHPEHRAICWKSSNFCKLCKRHVHCWTPSKGHTSAESGKTLCGADKESSLLSPPNHANTSASHGSPTSTASVPPLCSPTPPPTEETVSHSTSFSASPVSFKPPSCLEECSLADPTPESQPMSDSCPTPRSRPTPLSNPTPQPSFTNHPPWLNRLLPVWSPVMFLRWHTTLCLQDLSEEATSSLTVLDMSKLWNDKRLTVSCGDVLSGAKRQPALQPFVKKGYCLFVAHTPIPILISQVQK